MMKDIDTIFKIKNNKGKESVADVRLEMQNYSDSYKIMLLK